MSEHSKNIVLLLLSIIVSLVAANVGLWALRIADPPIYLHDPEIGYMAVPNQWPSSRGLYYHINHAGLRGPEFSESKQANAYRVVFIGDSVTFGGGAVSDKDTFVVRVGRSVGQELHSKTDTVNISAPGWGVQNMDAFISRYGLFRADLVIWMLPYEDFRRPKNFAPGMPTRRQFRLVCLAKHALEMARLRMFDMRGAREGSSRAPTSHVLEDNLAAFDHALRLIAKSGARALVIFFPMGDTPAVEDKEAYQSYQAVATRHRIGICDVCPLVEAAGGAALFYDGVHLNSLGHEVTADVVYSCGRRLLDSSGGAVRR